MGSICRSHLMRVDAMTWKDQHLVSLTQVQYQVKELPPNHQWFNSLELKFSWELSGKIIVLDFWTYCCINCLHTLPDIDWLQQKYEDYPQVVFIGCHSGKFWNEKDSEMVWEAILKYEVWIPVINDNKMIVWKNF